MQAEHAPEKRLVAPNPWATLSVHVVATPASHTALEVGGLSVHSFAEGTPPCAIEATRERAAGVVEPQPTGHQLDPHQSDCMMGLLIKL